jgi:hypothetical protein
MNPFEVYSWKAWFKTLDLQQLYQLRDRWYAACERSQGHERRVMIWDLIQVTKEIMRREGTHTPAASPTCQDS